MSYDTYIACIKFSQVPLVKVRRIKNLFVSFFRMAAFTLTAILSPFQKELSIAQVVPLKIIMKTQKKLIAALFLTVISVVALCMRFGSESEKDKTVTHQPEVEPTSSDSQREEPKLAKNQGSLIDIKNDSSVKAHAQSCGCAGCGSPITQISTAQKESSALKMTEVVQQNLFSKSKNFPVTFSLPDGGSASGIVEMTRQENGQTVMVQGQLTAPQKGRFFFQKQSQPGVAGSLVGFVRFDSGDIAYSVVPGADNLPELQQKHADNVFCRHYAALPEKALAPQFIPSDHPTNPEIPAYQNGVTPLSSLPAASAVVYLDFDGAEGPYETWGGDYTVAPANNGNADIRDIWERVVEDFAPYNINITTDLQKFLDAPEISRIRCIITANDTASPGAGGVAYVGSFNWSGDTPCWVFLTSGKNCAEAVSHEVGHAMGLVHDGRISPSEIYYEGHGFGATGWAPIMGLGYYENLTQWSKGEYSSADQFQDDLAIIDTNNNVDFRTDDHGDTLATASHLEILADNSVVSEGIIETTADEDGFKFTVTTNSSISLDIDPVSTGPNLDILAEIVDSGGGVVSSDNPTNSINASISTNLSAGEYVLRVSGVGKGDPLSTGYTDYGSLGFYKVTGTVTNAVISDRFSLAENPTTGDSIGTPTANNNHGGDAIAYSISSGNSSGAFAINPGDGALTVADHTQFDFEALSATYDDPATFELFVDITNSTTPALTETVRVVVTLTDINEAPTVIAGGTHTLIEAADVGSSIHTFVSNEFDIYDYVTYSIISGNTGGTFAIDSSTGELTIADNTAFTAGAVFNLTVEATDTGSPALTGSNSITINVDTFTHSLQSFWKMDDASGTTVTDNGDNSNDGSFVNTPVWSTGNTGGALTLDGIDNGVSIPSSASVTGTSDFTIATWIKTTTTTGGVIIQQRDEGGNGYVGQYVFSVNGSGTINFWVYNGSEQFSIASSALINDGNWHHVAAVRDGKNGYLYVDGVKSGSGSGEIKSLLAHSMSIGYDRRDNNKYLDGSLDDLAIFDQPLNGALLNALANNTSPVASNNVIAVVENTPAPTSIGFVSATDSDGDDSYLNFAITAGNSSGSFAIDSYTGEITIAGIVDYEAATSHALTVRAYDLFGGFDLATVTINVTNAAGADDSDADGLDDDWEVTHFGNTTAQSGSDDADSDGLTNLEENTASTNPNLADTDLDGFNDSIEIAAGTDANDILVFPTDGIYSGIVAWWRLDETSGTTASDYSANGHTGSFTDSPVWSGGLHAGALDLDGINDGVNLGSGPAIVGTGDFSLSAWVKTSSLDLFVYSPTT